jgi:hypothetical protein
MTLAYRNNSCLFACPLHQTRAIVRNWHIEKAVFLWTAHNSEIYGAVICHAECRPTNSMYFEEKTASHMKLQKIIVKEDSLINHK